MGYENKYNLMDESLFPRDSIFLAKENPKKAISIPLSREAISDEEIVASVSRDMADTLGAELEP